MGKSRHTHTRSLHSTDVMPSGMRTPIAAMRLGACGTRKHHNLRTGPGKKLAHESRLAKLFPFWRYLGNLKLPCLTLLASVVLSSEAPPQKALGTSVLGNVWR